MGSTSYSYENRSVRSANLGYFSKSTDEIFTQSRERKVHESMLPFGIKFREARDSENHPNTVPIIAGLDLTGSMGKIPHELVKEGLPTLMSTLIQKGIPDATLCFIGVGDHETDRGPLQIGQFESGDAELDMWLTRTWLEGGGGGNGGESYLLAWYFAAFHTKTDAWDKRKEKGFLFTIGDEPNLHNLPVSAIRELIGEGQSSYTASKLLELAQEKWNVFHIVVHHSAQADRSIEGWKNVLGQNCIVVNDAQDVPKTIAQIVLDNTPKGKVGISENLFGVPEKPKEEEIL